TFPPFLFTRHTAGGARSGKLGRKKAVTHKKRGEADRLPGRQDLESQPQRAQPQLHTGRFQKKKNTSDSSEPPNSACSINSNQSLGLQFFVGTASHHQSTYQLFRPHVP